MRDGDDYLKAIAAHPYKLARTLHPVVPVATLAAALAFARSSPRVLAAADVGYRMKCQVTGLHATYGGSSPAFTAKTAVVA